MKFSCIPLHTTHQLLAPTMRPMITLTQASPRRSSEGAVERLRQHVNLIDSIGGRTVTFVTVRRRGA